VCAHAVRVALENIQGVGSVNVSLNQGAATATLRPDNSVRLAQLYEAIRKNGFVTKEVKASIAGTIVRDRGDVALKVSGTADVFALKFEKLAQESVRPSAIPGKTVLVEGIFPAVSAGELPKTFSVTALTPIGANQ
jgi:copper chaperone CopZ